MDNLKVRIYFCREPDAEFIMQRKKISKAALNTIYDLVWECEFKNFVNVGLIWLKFREEKEPFGVSLRKKRSHERISPHDIIEISNDFYIVDNVGARKMEAVDQNGSFI